MIGAVGRENRIGSGHVLQTVLIAMLHAVAHMVEVVPTKEPQRYTDRAGGLMKQLTELIGAGTFSKLNS